MAKDEIKELCGKLNALAEEHGSVVFDLAEKKLGLTPKQGERLELACTQQAFEEVIKEFGVNVADLEAYTDGVTKLLGDEKLSVDDKLKAANAVSCKATILVGHEHTDEEFSQCVQDIRATDKLLAR